MTWYRRCAQNYLIYLKAEYIQPVGTETGRYQMTMCVNEQEEPVLTQAPVSAVLSSSGKIADQHCALAYCLQEGKVQVYLGYEVLPYRGSQVAVNEGAPR